MKTFENRCSSSIGWEVITEQSYSYYSGFAVHEQEMLPKKRAGGQSCKKNFSWQMYISTITRGSEMQSRRGGGVGAVLKISD